MTSSDQPIAVRLYGIPNCDTVKRSRQWFAEQEQPVDFHDFKKQGVDATLLAQFADALGWEALLNRRGTTWRKLSEAERSSAEDRAGALALLQQHPSLVKRPVVAISQDSEVRYSVGFVPDTWQKAFSA